PVVDISGTVAAGAESFKGEIKGAWPDFMPINKHVVDVGRDLCWLDVERAQRVCVVGRSVVDRLWPETPGYNAVGETIVINQRPFRIIGIFQFYEREEEKRRREMGISTPQTRSPRSRRDPGMNRWSPWARKNNQIVIPVSTALYEFRSAN